MALGTDDAYADEPRRPVGVRRRTRKVKTTAAANSPKKISMSTTVRKPINLLCCRRSPRATVRACLTDGDEYQAYLDGDEYERWRRRWQRSFLVTDSRSPSATRQLEPNFANCSPATP